MVWSIYAKHLPEQSTGYCDPCKLQSDIATCTPILTSSSRSVVNDWCSISYGSTNI